MFQKNIDLQSIQNFYNLLLCIKNRFVRITYIRVPRFNMIPTELYLPIAITVANTFINGKNAMPQTNV